MSYVLSIRRAEDQPPFAAEELERLVQAHEGLGLERGILTWSSGNAGRVELFVGARELRADRVSAGVQEQALEVLQTIARELNARLYGEEGEDITCAPASQVPESPWRGLLGGLLVVIAVPFTLLLALLRLPWLLWKVSRRIK